MNNALKVLVAPVIAAGAMVGLSAVASASPYDTPDPSPRRYITNWCQVTTYNCPDPSVSGVELLPPPRQWSPPSPSRQEYPTGGIPGTWQVYATPPNSGLSPGPQWLCGVNLPYQGAPNNCPAGWDLWYR